MKTWLVVIVSLLLGVATGLGATWASLAGGGRIPESKLPGLPAPPPVGGPQPAASVDHTEFDFGLVERESSHTHAFPIRNDGQFPLEIMLLGTACGKCTFAHVAKGHLLPGESTELVVEYRAVMGDGDFRKSARFSTNDPRRSFVELFVSGSVAASHELSPKELSFGTVSARDTHTAEAKLYSHLTDDLEIPGHELVVRETADRFRVETAPLAGDELGSAKAKSGAAIRVTVLPGLPLGSHAQTIRLRTNLPQQPTLDLAVNVTVTSDIAVIGGGWQADKGLLTLGAVSQGTAAKRTLLLVARGPHRHDVHFQVRSAEPAWLKVTFGEPRDINSGAAVQVPMEIEVPADAPRADFMGATRDSWSRLTLDTGHPDAPQLQILLRFAVER